MLSISSQKLFKNLWLLVTISSIFSDLSKGFGTATISKLRIIYFWCYLRLFTFNKHYARIQQQCLENKYLLHQYCALAISIPLRRNVMQNYENSQFKIGILSVFFLDALMWHVDWVGTSKHPKLNMYYQKM